MPYIHDESPTPAFVVKPTRSIRKPTSMIDPNRQNSPLLRLPAELRNKIYAYAVGNELVHVSVRSDNSPWTWSPADGCLAMIQARGEEKSLCHHLCEAEETEFEAAAKPPSKKPAPLPTAMRQRGAVKEPPTSPSYRHRHCHPSANSSRHLSLSLLRTCRAIYHEARLLPYSTNTFSFAGAKAFSRFVLAALRKDQAAAMRAVRFEASIAGIYWGGWNELLSEQVAELVKGIEIVGLALEIPSVVFRALKSSESPAITNRDDEDMIEEELDEEEIQDPIPDTVFHGFLRLRQNRLKKVVVALEKEAFELLLPGEVRPPPVTEEERQAFARILERKFFATPKVQAERRRY